MSTIIQKPRDTVRVPKAIRKLRLEPFNQIIRNDEINRNVIKNRPRGRLELNNRTGLFTDNDLITFMRLVDTMHDITEREPIAKKLGITPTALTRNIRLIYGDIYAEFYQAFATEMMQLVEKEFNNIKVIKARLYNYVTKLSPSQFNKGRRVEFQFDTPITSNRVSNITPVLLNRMIRTMEDTRFVVDATKYSLNTNMRLESVKHSNKQLLTFSQLIDPSTISGKFDKYLLDIHNEGHFAQERYIFAYIHSFTEMEQHFDYYYVMNKDTFAQLQRNGNALFLKDYTNQFAIVCFRSLFNKPGSKRHVPFLNAYVLNSNFFGNRNTATESFVDNLMFVTYNNLYHKNKSKLSFENFHVYKSSTFTKDKLSIEKLVEMASTDRERLRIALEYKRSFDSLQMHYQAHLNDTPAYIKYANTNVSEEHKENWNLFHNSTIISFDILSGLFGFLYGANVMIEYRGTYRMYSIDQTGTMSRVASAAVQQRVDTERFRRVLARLQNVMNNQEKNSTTTNENVLFVKQAANILRNGTNNVNLKPWINGLNRIEQKYNKQINNNERLPPKKRKFL